MRVFIVSQYPAAKRGNQPENAMTEEEAKKKQLLAAYAWGRHSAAAPECFALDPDKLVALCAMGVMPPKVEKGAGSTPATGSAGNGGSVGEQPAATCVATTTNTMSAGEKTAGATPAPWELVSVHVTGGVLRLRVRSTEQDVDVCDLTCSDDDAEAVATTWADARLIVTSPEMLKMLRRVTRELAALGKGRVSVERLVDEACALGNKAEGRT